MLKSAPPAADERGAVIPPPEPELPDPKPSDPAAHDSDPPPSLPESSPVPASPVEASSADAASAEAPPAEAAPTEAPPAEPASDGHHGPEPEPEPDLLEPRAPRPSRAKSPAPKAHTSAACDEARAGMRAFVAGPTPVGPPPAWRTHMSACTACTFAYHELVKEAARLARGATKVAGRTTDTLASERARRSLIAANAGRGGKLPRLFLPISVIALVVVIVSQSRASRLELRSLAGNVTRGRDAVKPDDVVGVQRGDGCSTGASARAELLLGESRIAFGPESSFLVDRTDKLAVRFFAGEAQVEGDATLILPLGAVEVRAGAASVRLQDGITLIRCERGDVTRTDASGRHLVLPDETQRIEPPAAADAAR